MAKKRRRFLPTKEQIRRHIPSDNTLFFALQLIFCFVQCVIFMVCLGHTINPLLILLYGAVLLLLGLKSQIKACHVSAYVLFALMTTVTVIMTVGFTLVAQDQTGVKPLELTVHERIGFAVSYVITVLQPILLVSIPAFILTARIAKGKTDTILLHILSWVMIALAGLMLYLVYDPTLTGYLLVFKGLSSISFFSAEVLLWVFAAASVALAIAVFMLYPFGTKRIKNAVEKARAKLPKQG